MALFLRNLIGSLLITTSLVAITVTHAAPAQDKTIDRLMVLSDIQNVIKETNKELKPMFDEQAKVILKDTLDTDTLNAKQLIAADKISVLMSKITSDITEDPKFYNMLKSNYQKTFTEEEALANIAFLESSVGKSINRKTAKLMTDVMAESQELAQQALQDPNKKAQFIEEFKKVLDPLIKEKSK